jgi:protein-S-isoprenylcysteine O-methyltransferase Ste14
MKEKHFIDSHKGATGLAILGLMNHFEQWDNPTAWVYLALHGSYGLLWVIKSNVFGDRNWEKPTSVGYGLLIWTSLTLYWIAPYIICSQGIQMPLPWLAACISVFSLGIFLHFASDMQKHTTLSIRPGLITTGLWSRLRNPNYFGELLIYLGFVAIPLHPLPLAALAAMVFGYWVPNMRRKDHSLSRHQGWQDYKAKSWCFIPLVW